MYLQSSLTPIRWSWIYSLHQIVATCHTRRAPIDIRECFVERGKPNRFNIRIICSLHKYNILTQATPDSPFRKVLSHIAIFVAMLRLNPLEYLLPESSKPGSTHAVHDNRLPLYVTQQGIVLHSDGKQALGIIIWRSEKGKLLRPFNYSSPVLTSR